MSNYSKIKTFDIANGEGIRTSIFFSGCEHYCKNCFNSELWDFNVGQSFTKEVYESKIKPTMNEHITGISILGGEPLHPNNITATFNLVKWFKEDFPKKTIWLWSGYTWEELTSKSNSNYKINIGILNNIDVLVDGKYVDELRDISLKWCGSTNQRVINVQESLKENKIVLYS
mgnify:CR=1 FL=1